MEGIGIDLTGLDQDDINELYNGYFKAPEVIYLQRSDGALEWLPWPSGTSWCDDKIDKFDVGYVRMDLYDEIKSELDKERLFISLYLSGGERADELLEQTRCFDEHPDWYDDACLCQLCCSYGD